MRVPRAIRAARGGPEMLYRTLQSIDRRGARLEADAWEVSLRAEWRLSEGGDQSSAIAAIREIYRATLEAATTGELGEAPGYREAADPLDGGIAYALDRIEGEAGERPLTALQSAKVWALNDARDVRAGKRADTRAELELSLSELAAEHMRLWRLAPGRKSANTGAQKQASFDLFALFFGNGPIRTVRRADASRFADALRELDPNWARSGKAGGGAANFPTWAALMRQFGGQAEGLSDATVNRHLATLATLWLWAEGREHCEGRNPFDGHRRKLTEGRNRLGYTAWETDELGRLFDPPPRRSDLAEVMLVAMFTGMRLNEIASLTFGQIGEAEGVKFIDVIDAKTPAGVRKVPLHPRLAWLAKRGEGKLPSARVWDKFSGEGPGRKPGGDAGKLFSAHKLRLGFTDRRKVFHSLRKNVVGQLERARVPQNEVAQLVGHEKQGLTFGTYGERMDLPRLAKIVALIGYPEVSLPRPAGSRR